MLKDESAFARILEACWQARVLGELMTDQSHIKLIYWTRGCYFYYNIARLAGKTKLHALSPPPAARNALGIINYALVSIIIITNNVVRPSHHSVLLQSGFVRCSQYHL